MQAGGAPVARGLDRRTAARRMASLETVRFVEMRPSTGNAPTRARSFAAETEDCR